MKALYMDSSIYDVIGKINEIVDWANKEDMKNFRPHWAEDEIKEMCRDRIIIVEDDGVEMENDLSKNNDTINKIASIGFGALKTNNKYFGVLGALKVALPDMLDYIGVQIINGEIVFP